jgi:hypothetical protein
LRFCSLEKSFLFNIGSLSHVAFGLLVVEISQFLPKVWGIKRRDFPVSLYDKMHDFTLCLMGKENNEAKQPIMTKNQARHARRKAKRQQERKTRGNQNVSDRDGNRIEVKYVRRESVYLDLDHIWLIYLDFQSLTNILP